MALKIQVLSDLHLDFAPLRHPRTDADVVVLAGDIGSPAEAVEWAAGFDQPVLLVPGNHEYYGGSLDATAADLRRRCAGRGVHLLDCASVRIGTVRFLGATLWTDFALYGASPAQRAAALQAASSKLRDFSRIRLRDADAAPFTPEHACTLHQREQAWLEQRLTQPHDGPTVVVTHHAPSPASVHPRFAGSPVNPCFASDLRHLHRDGRIALWVHGHTHDSFDYRSGRTRVVCNPRGYVRDGRAENPAFDPKLVVVAG